MEKARKNREKMDKQRKKELEQVRKNSNSSGPGEGATEWHYSPHYYLTIISTDEFSISRNWEFIAKGAIELPLDELKPKFPDMDFVIFTEQYSGFFFSRFSRMITAFLVSYILCLINIYLFAYGEYVYIEPEHISS